MDDLRLWDSSNLLVEEIYCTDNYEVIDYNNGKLCYIFFSSNGLFFPNTISQFQKTVIGSNRYEWKRMATCKEIISKSGRHIFVRDIYKQWYVRGINSTINSVDKMISLLKTLTEGYEVITVGSSAGGYVAALVAAKLSAKVCFDFSGQISLWEVSQTNPFIKEGIHHEEVKKYYDIAEIIGRSECIYYYFYPQYNECDVKQFARISTYQNVKGFVFREKNHAATMLAGNMRYIICKDYEYMNQLYQYYEGKVISKIVFLFKTVPIIKALRILVKEIRKYMKRKYKTR